MRPTVLVLGVVIFLAMRASAAPVMPVIDQEPGPDRFAVFLRVEFFAPVGQSFVPQFRRHVGVNLFLRNLLLGSDQPPAIFTVTLRTGSVTGPILARSSTPPLPLFGSRLYVPPTSLRQFTPNQG